MPDASYELALQIAELDTLESRREKACQKLFKTFENPEHKLNYLVPEKKDRQRESRIKCDYQVPKFKNDRFKASFINHCILKMCNL